MNKNVVIGAIVVVIVVVIGYMWLSKQNQQTTTENTTGSSTDEYATMPANDEETTSAPLETSMPSVSALPTDVTAGEVKEFTITGSNFKFDLPEMRVKQGDTVKVTFKNAAGNHDWNLDEFNAKTKVLAAGQQETVQFVVDKKGQFEYYCSVGTHRQMGMKGTLIVQ